jgi:Aspartyl protease
MIVSLHRWLRKASFQMHYRAFEQFKFGRCSICGLWVLQAPLKVAGHYITTSITVLEQKSGPQFIFGLDMLKRHQVCCHASKVDFSVHKSWTPLAMRARKLYAGLSIPSGIDVDVKT